jgi:hypothetical protein
MDTIADEKFRNRVYSINQTDTENEEGLRKDRINLTLEQAWREEEEVKEAQ